MHQYRLGKASVESLLERSSAEKDLVVLGENKLPMSQQCALVAKKAKRILGWIRKSIASHSKEVILLFYSALVRPYLCPVLGSSVAERDGVPRIGPVNGNKDDQHIEKLSYKERVRELGPFSLEKDVWEGMSISIWREGTKKMEPGCSRWCWAKGQEAMGRNWHTGTLIWIRWRTSLLCEWPCTGTDFPERPWNLPHWRYSSTVWIQSCDMCTRMTLPEKGGWARWTTVVPFNLKFLQSVQNQHTHSVILWDEATPA